MRHCLDETNTESEAFKSHADQLRSVASHLDEIASVLAKHSDRCDEFDLQADTHYIGLSVPDDIADDLIKKGLATLEEFEEEEEMEDELAMER